jgi:hypothetical protein
VPAVDRARLARQAAHIAEAADDSQALQRRFRDVMEFYADRTRRPTPDTEGYGAPAIVVRTVASALIAKAVSPEREALWADLLWSIRLREARLAAAILIRDQPASDLLDRILAWAGDTRDPEVLRELAGPTLGDLRRRAPSEFLRAMKTGVASGNPGRRAFALRALADAAADRQFQGLPDALEVMARGWEAPVGDEARALLLLVVALARRTPGESARMLREALEARKPWAYRLAAAALPELPEATRASLQRSLSASRAAGIMPRLKD